MNNVNNKLYIYKAITSYRHIMYWEIEREKAKMSEHLAKAWRKM